MWRQALAVALGLVAFVSLASFLTPSCSGPETDLDYLCLLPHVVGLVAFPVATLGALVAAAHPRRRRATITWKVAGLAVVAAALSTWALFFVHECHWDGDAGTCSPPGWLVSVWQAALVIAAIATVTHMTAWVVERRFPWSG